MVCRIHSYSSLTREPHLPQQSDRVAHVDPGFLYFLHRSRDVIQDSSHWVDTEQKQMIKVIFQTLFFFRATDVCISAPSIATKIWDSARAGETAKNPEETRLSGLPHS